MELLDETEIKHIVSQVGSFKVLKWTIEDYANTLIGYLGDHLRLRIDVESENIQKQLNFFVKCMPRFDKIKAEYLKELLFFEKEYVALSKIFKEFQDFNDSLPWRPKLLFSKENVFVFEDVAEMGYFMPDNRTALPYNQIVAVIETLARFHAKSFIYEETKSKELNRPYRMWEDFAKYLKEPRAGIGWRNTGKKAAVDFLKTYSSYKSTPNFCDRVDALFDVLFDEAWTLMLPSNKYRNAVVHRDLWPNNILLKQENGKMHALFVDFQTVIYCSPMVDLSSVIYFNTTRAFRDYYTDELINIYYDILSNELKRAGIDVKTIYEVTDLRDAYKDSLVFGMTQAAIIVPITAMESKTKMETFSDPETCHRLNVVSRSEEFIKVAKEDDIHRVRVIEILDEIVETFMLPGLL